MAEPSLTLEIDASEINELLKQFPEYQDIVLKELEIEMVGSLFMFQELIQGNTPDNKGTLRQSFIRSSPVVRGQTLTGRVATSKPYGFPIERGRTPGKKMPPVRAIELWVRRKLGIKGNESKGVAFVIARKIAKSGFSKKRGWRMVEQAFAEGSPKAIKLFDSAIQKSVAEMEKRIEAIG